MKELKNKKIEISTVEPKNFKTEKVEIKIGKSLKIHDLEWDKKERFEIEEKILSLRNHQIGALANILTGFFKQDIENIVKDVKENGRGSGHLAIIIEEAESKEKVRWWVDYFYKNK